MAFIYLPSTQFAYSTNHGTASAAATAIAMAIQPSLISGLRESLRHERSGRT
jgi:hypothetical protein